jgi:hypothetical protein
MSTALVARVGIVAVVCILACSSTTSAQTLGDVAKLIGGASAGLAIHESAHVAADFANGVAPGVKKVTFGPFPFFAITHDAVSPTREFVVSSAGFWAQHAVSEYLLTRRPALRTEHAPVLKGILAFTGPNERDTRGMAISAGMDEPAIGALILVPAILDTVRYFGGERGWVVWASRAAKIGGVLLVVKAAQ